MASPDRGIRLVSADPAPVALGTMWVNTTLGLVKLAVANDGTSPLNGILNTTWFVLTSVKSIVNPIIETDFAAAVTAFPANSLIAGRSLRVSIGGTFQIGAVASTCRVFTFFNGVAGTQLGSPQLNNAIQFPASAIVEFIGNLYFTQQTTGAAGAWSDIGFIHNNVKSSTFTTAPTAVIQATGTINTTVQQQFGVGALFGTSDPGNQANLSVCVGEILI